LKRGKSIMLGVGGSCQFEDRQELPWKEQRRMHGNWRQQYRKAHKRFERWATSCKRRKRVLQVHEESTYGAEFVRPDRALSYDSLLPLQFGMTSE